MSSETKLITETYPMSTDGFKGKCSNLLVGHVLGFNIHANLHSKERTISIHYFWLAILNIDNRTLPFQTLVVSIFVPEGNFAFPTVGDS